ncbi:DUF1508 domain-containing protein [Arthrobacter sp. BHU FT2]|nr:DUF1508 domain-containing protein [Arthrobacter sp. BHU FT2]
MAGKFEVFLDPEAKFRFRLLGPDGTVMAESQPFDDKAALAAGIAAVRECAGTGLVTDLCPQGVQGPAVPSRQDVPASAGLSCDDQAATRLRVFAAAKGVRHHVAPARWERRRDHAAMAN